MLPPDFTFSPMRADDVVPALRIIADWDTDDAQEAAETYRESTIGHYVLRENDVVVGVTGMKSIDGTDRAWAISWTYLHRELIGQGLGSEMLERVLELIGAEDGRKVFVNTSDYYSDEDGDIYRDAREAYERVGFVEELRHPNFYEPGETQITLAKRIQPRVDRHHEPPDFAGVRFIDIGEIDECDDAYFLAWELDNVPTTGDPAGLAPLMKQARKWGARVVFAALPSDLVDAIEQMTRAQFRVAGSLVDYYEDGIDEVHLRYDLE